MNTADTSIVKPLKISIIGAGNVGFNLGKALKKQGFGIFQVFSRSREKAEKLATETGAEAVTDLSKLQNEADLVIIAVKDDAISEVAAALPFKPKNLVHTSGAVSTDVLKDAGESYGIFYPMYSFTTAPVDFKEVPFFISSENEAMKALLKSVAEALGSKTYEITDKQRQYLHLAAVFANNFTNFMAGISKEIADDNKLEFKVLQTLFKETIKNVLSGDPVNMQTGPARRADIKTLEAHLHLLEDYPEYRQIYQLLSENIMKKYSPK